MIELSNKEILKLDEILFYLSENKKYLSEKQYIADKLNLDLEEYNFLYQKIIQFSMEEYSIGNILDKNTHYKSIECNFSTNRFIKNGGFTKYFKAKKESELRNNKTTIMAGKDVFVTYSWDSEEHNENVLSFTDFLREKGFDAEIDKFHSQKETATDFNKMMHQALTDYKKVIIVLSKGYKDKAEKFKGGVGNEYNMIIKDIETSKNKYILISFEPISDEITPLFFKGRQIIDLTNKKNLNELFAKLQDEKIYEFSNVGSDKPIVEKRVIPKFEINESKPEIGNLIVSVYDTSQLNLLYTKIEYELTVEIKNETDETFSDYSIEIYYPLKSTEYDIDGRIDGNYKIITYENNPKLFSKQTRGIKIERLLLRHFSVKNILDNNIIVKLYYEKGLVEKDFNLREVLYINSNNGKENLIIQMFQDENYRQ